jgi:hypothetical protein
MFKNKSRRHPFFDYQTRNKLYEMIVIDARSKSGGSWKVANLAAMAHLMIVEACIFWSANQYWFRVFRV